MAPEIGIRDTCQHGTGLGTEEVKCSPVSGAGSHDLARLMCDGQSLSYSWDQWKFFRLGRLWLSIRSCSGGIAAAFPTIINASLACWFGFIAFDTAFPT